MISNWNLCTEYFVADKERNHYRRGALALHDEDDFAFEKEGCFRALRLDDHGICSVGTHVRLEDGNLNTFNISKVL